MPTEIPLGSLQLAELFDGLPRVMFSLKDIDGRYIFVNQAFAQRVPHLTASEIVGRSAHDIFEPELAISYRAQDLAVLRSGRPVRRQLELITRPGGSLGWYITNKTLLHDSNDQPVAIMAVSIDEQIPANQPGMKGLEKAITTVHARYREPLSIGDLAESAGMSVAMLERRMKRLIGQTPNRLIVRVRVEEAVELIIRGSKKLAEIASECGFTDQAAMSKQVKQLLGVSPRDLRQARKAD
jgi:PAS domain S-box-containing protein